MRLANDPPIVRLAIGAHAAITDRVVQRGVIVASEIVNHKDRRASIKVSGGSTSRILWLEVSGGLFIRLRQANFSDKGIHFPGGGITSWNACKSLEGRGGSHSWRPQVVTEVLARAQCRNMRCSEARFTTLVERGDGGFTTFGF